MPTNPIPRIFIGYDPVEAKAFHTMCHSIWSRASGPVSIIPIMLSSLPEMTRERDPMQSNDFSFSRWLVPYLCDYVGHAIFMDCDMLVVDDIYNLWNERFNMFETLSAVSVVKHDHVPKETTKYLGQTQSVYEKKNWSSVMLIDCAACTALTPEYVNTASGLELHQFKWLGDDERIGELPARWNHLVGYDKSVPVSDLSNIHFTIGGPYFKDYASCSYASLWWDEYKKMTYCAQPSTPQHQSEVSIKL